MESSKFNVIENFLLIFVTTMFGLFLFYPIQYNGGTNTVFSTRVFTNIVIGGDIVEPEIVTPIVPPIPAITPVPVPVPTPAPTPIITNSVTNSVTNSINSTNQ